MNDELLRKVLDFRDSRDWGKFHNAKDLAISLSIEASELLEHFQWRSSEEAVHHRKVQIAEELADVLIYSIYLADTMDLNIEKIIYEKMKKNEEKYPVEKSYGRMNKYTEL
ncbi:nucleotide pyrophosphohydrolase [Paenibacillus faecalis]|uniref:nucleotide pyrophosphohydrolase n=1 Tax=Paenibacillus faecalis TaxID=2079532 RepID=UPI000D0F608F|nr:nucleotide pyrophosphohydrolase [Paenibacillus faecalis]